MKVAHWALAAGLALTGCSSDSDDAGAGAAGATGASAGAIVFDEFSAVGSSEWIELSNGGSTAVDLGGHAVADSDKKTGHPRLDHALRFPAGTQLGPGEHLLILVSEDEAGGPFSGALCLGTAGSCFHATFGVSASDGEAVHLLGPGDTVLVTTAYPKSVSIDASMSDRTACRLPDTTGEFALCVATPGATNAAP